MRIVESSKLFVFNPSGEVLYLQRSAHDPNRPLAFDLPGGEVEAGEDPLHGGIRETLQEVGLAIERRHAWRLLWNSARSQYGHANFRNFFVARIDEPRPDLTVDRQEVQWAGWGRLTEVATILGHETQRYAAGLLLRRLSAAGS